MNVVHLSPDRKTEFFWLYSTIDCVCIFCMSGWLYRLYQFVYKLIYLNNLNICTTLHNYIWNNLNFILITFCINNNTYVMGQNADLREDCLQRFHFWRYSNYTFFIRKCVVVNPQRTLSIGSKIGVGGIWKTLYIVQLGFYAI